MCSIAVTFLSRSYGALSSLLLSIVVSRLLSPEDAGNFFYGFTALVGMVVISRFGIDSILIKKISVSKSLGHDSSEIIQSAVFLGLFIGFLVSFLAYSFFYFLYFFGVILKDVFDILSVFVLFVPFFTVLWMRSAYLKGGGKSAIANFFEVGVVPTIFLSITSICYYSGYEISLFYFVVFYGVSVTLSSFISFIAFWGEGFKNGMKIKKNELKKYVVEGFPLMIANFSDFIIIWVSSFLLAFYGDMSEFANYNVAQRVAILISFILIVSNSVYASKYAVLYHNKDFAGLNYIAQRSALIMTLFSVPVFILVVLFSKEIMSVFGVSYGDSVFYLVILSVAQLFNVVTGANGYILIMAGFNKEFRNIVVFSAVFTVLLSVIFVYFFGVYGTAVSTFLGVILKNSLGVYFCFKKVGVVPLPNLKFIIKIKV